MTVPNAVDADFLKRVYMFQDLEEEEILKFAQIMKPRHYAAGQVVMKEGEPGDSMCVIAEGEVEVNKALTMKFGEDDFRETEKVMTVLTSDDHAVVGEMSMFINSGRSATITARTDCMLYEISREDFLKLSRENTALGLKVTFRLAELISGRLKNTGDDVIRLTTALSIALTR